MSSAPVSHWHKGFAGELTKGERRYCAILKNGIQAVIERKASVDQFVRAVRDDMGGLQSFEFDPDAAFDAQFRSAVEAMPLSGMNQNANPSEAELAFLQDVDGLISFVTRNGLNFSLVLGILGHDVAEIAARGGIEAARAAGVHLKVTGWAKRNAEVVGEPEE